MNSTAVADDIRSKDDPELWAKAPRTIAATSNERFKFQIMEWLMQNKPLGRKISPEFRHLLSDVAPASEDISGSRIALKSRLLLYAIDHGSNEDTNELITRLNQSKGFEREASVVIASSQYQRLSQAQREILIRAIMDIRPYRSAAMILAIHEIFKTEHVRTFLLFEDIPDAQAAIGDIILRMELSSMNISRIKKSLQLSRSNSGKVYSEQAEILLYICHSIQHKSDFSSSIKKCKNTFETLNLKRLLAGVDDAKNDESRLARLGKIVVTLHKVVGHDPKHRKTFEKLVTQLKIESQFPAWVSHPKLSEKYLKTLIAQLNQQQLSPTEIRPLLEEIDEYTDLPKGAQTVLAQLLFHKDTVVRKWTGELLERRGLMDEKVFEYLKGEMQSEDTGRQSLAITGIINHFDDKLEGTIALIDFLATDSIVEFTRISRYFIDTKAPQSEDIEAALWEKFLKSLTTALDCKDTEAGSLILRVISKLIKDSKDVSSISADKVAQTMTRTTSWNKEFSATLKEFFGINKPSDSKPEIILPSRIAQFFKLVIARTSKPTTRCNSLTRVLESWSELQPEAHEAIRDAVRQLITEETLDAYNLRSLQEAAKDPTKLNFPSDDPIFLKQAGCQSTMQAKKPSTRVRKLF